MRLLSLTQPWATLVAIGAKRVETRSWTTSYRGEIAIHASREFPKAARDLMLSGQVRAALWHADIRIPDDLPRGMVVAVARLTLVLDTRTMREVLNGEQRWAELEFGNYGVGRWAWCLDDVQRLPTPILWRGALGLRQVPVDLEARIRNEVTRLG